MDENLEIVDKKNIVTLIKELQYLNDDVLSKFNGNSSENGLLFELGIIKKDIEEYNSQQIKNNIYHLILIGSVCFLFGWIACSVFYNIKPPVIQTMASSNNSNTKLKNEDIAFVSVNEFEKKFNEFKFNGKTFEYKGVTVNEGDVLGNIKVEYIIPDAQIRIWDIKEGYPLVLMLNNQK